MSAPFISYSINYEDVVLRRLFPGRLDGFFVDVGAQDPCIDNDFYGLSQLGWTGIDVEPNPAYAALLRAQRPRDLVVEQPISDIAGQDLVFHEVESTGLSTFDAAQARSYAADGFTVRTHDLRTTTLADMLDRACPPHIDVLKVDVEGFEERVLRGHDFSRWRPSVIVVEVTFPNTPRRRLSGIPDMLEGLGYQKILFDNLNDFWAADEFAVPDGATLPPNVFDRFIRHETAQLQADVERLQTSYSEADRYAHSLEEERAALNARLVAADAYAQSLQGERQSFSARLAELETYAQALEAERETLRAGKTKAEADSRAANAARAAAQTACDTLAAQLAVETARSRQMVLVAQTCLAGGDHAIARVLAPLGGGTTFRRPAAGNNSGKVRADG